MMKKSRRKFKSKNRNCEHHFKTRLYERFGINPTPNLFQDVIHQIQSGESKVIETQSNQRVVHQVIIDSIPVCVVYNSHKKVIHTVLPSNYEPGKSVSWTDINGSITTYSGYSWKFS